MPADAGALTGVWSHGRHYPSPAPVSGGPRAVLRRPRPRVRARRGPRGAVCVCVVSITLVAPLPPPLLPLPPTRDYSFPPLLVTAPAATAAARARKAATASQREREQPEQQEQLSTTGRTGIRTRIGTGIRIREKLNKRPDLSGSLSPSEKRPAFAFGSDESIFSPPSFPKSRETPSSSARSGRSRPLPSPPRQRTFGPERPRGPVTNALALLPLSPRATGRPASTGIGP